MTDFQSELSAAAEASYPGEEVFPRVHKQGFIAGAKWALNSQAVRGLVEALEKLDAHMDKTYAKPPEGYVSMSKAALSAFRSAQGKEGGDDVR